jgi:hypothetical protein
MSEGHGKLLIEGTNDDDGGWAPICAVITTAMKEINTERSYWDCTVTGQGWRFRTGYKNDFKAETGEELLQAILPRTDCMFKVYVDKAGHKIHINNFHHDSPTGAEWYTISVHVEDDEE